MIAAVMEEEDSARYEPIVERLESERDGLIVELRGVWGQIGEIADRLDVDLADVDYWAVEEAMEHLPSVVDGASGLLADLSLLSWILLGDDRPDRSADLAPIVALDLDTLFVDEEEDDPRGPARERVGLVARHLVRRVMAAESSFDHAIGLAEDAQGDEAIKGLDHTRQLVVAAGEDFRLWCETLEGYLAQSGSYPGIAGEQVDGFRSWLKQQRP